MVLTGHPFRKAYVKSPIDDIEFDDDQIRVVERRVVTHQKRAFPGSATGNPEIVRARPWTRTEIRANGNQPVRRRKSSKPDSLSNPSDFHSNLAECSTDSSLPFCP